MAKRDYETMVKCGEVWRGVVAWCPYGAVVTMVTMVTMVVMEGSKERRESKK